MTEVSLTAAADRQLRTLRWQSAEALVISGWVRGLSTRDIEATLAETLGPDATVSKSTVSQICTAIHAQFDAFKARDLSGLDLAYLYVDVSHFRYHHGAHAEPVLVAYGITTDGAPVLLGVDGVASESDDACAALLRSLVARGLRPPLLTISDGGPGVCGQPAAAERFPVPRPPQRHQPVEPPDDADDVAEGHPDDPSVGLGCNRSAPTGRAPGRGQPSGTGVP